MRRLACLAVLLALTGCGAQPTATPSPSAPPPTRPPTATARPTATVPPVRTSSATATLEPTVPAFVPPPLPTLAPATQRYAEDVGLALDRLGDNVAAVGQGCVTLDQAACRRAYDANRPLYDREAARVAALTAPPACIPARDRLGAALVATGRLFADVDLGLRGGGDALTLLGTAASDAAAAGQALQDLGAELANGTCR